MMPVHPRRLTPRRKRRSLRRGKRLRRAAARRRPARERAWRLRRARSRRTRQARPRRAASIQKLQHLKMLVMPRRAVASRMRPMLRKARPRRTWPGLRRGKTRRTRLRLRRARPHPLPAMPLQQWPVRQTAPLPLAALLREAAAVAEVVAEPPAEQRRALLLRQAHCRRARHLQRDLRERCLRIRRWAPWPAVAPPQARGPSAQPVRCRRGLCCRWQCRLRRWRCRRRRRRGRATNWLHQSRSRTRRLQQAAGC
mmetsp:Transcript_79896/g.146072  ORF Transcript_79896/g.146072 Transcript_79896/m.146072 type:complete len:254 (+) Transcript_79896:1267-2028(+)